MSCSSWNARLVHAITAKGHLEPVAGDASPILEQRYPDTPAVHTFILNRPKALHSLNFHMVSAIYNRLRSFEMSDTMKCVIIRSKGTERRAFCAGGDVRSLYFIGKEQTYHPIDEFFRAEYSMNSLIARLKNTTLVSIMDGIVMGGGVGLVMYGKYRIATENTVLAMPECAIGLHPDVGASFFLSRLPSNYGMYMGLTGSRLKGIHLVTAGFATHYVPSESIEQLLCTLEKATSPNDSFISETLKRFERKVPSSEMLPGADISEEAFTLGSVEEIEARLKEIAETNWKNNSELARSALKGLQGACPTSLKVAFESISRGKSSSLDECLKSEFRLTTRCVRRNDFYAGVGSVLITKDRNPQWNPLSISEVESNDVDQFFEPLKTDCMVPELDLDHWEGLSKHNTAQARM